MFVVIGGFRQSGEPIGSTGDTGGWGCTLCSALWVSSDAQPFLEVCCFHGATEQTGQQDKCVSEGHWKCGPVLSQGRLASPVFLSAVLWWAAAESSSTNHHTHVMSRSQMQWAFGALTTADTLPGV